MAASLDAPPKPEMEGSLYAGAVATAVVGLLPWVNVFILPAYAIGALVAVHYAAGQGQRLEFKSGAKLGFLSTFCGSMVAVVLADLLWAFFDYQLWQNQNSQLMLAMFRSFASPVTVDAMAAAFAESAAKPFRWYLLILQLLGNAVFCGIFGTLFGLLGVKLFAPKPQQTPV